MTINNNNVNITKKALRFLGIVWAAALTVLCFAILLLRFDLIQEVVTSTPVISVICLVVGAAIGFIAGAIVCYFNTVKAVDARDKRIEKLQNELASINQEYRGACKALAKMYPQYATHEKKAAEAANSTRVSKIFGEIAELSEESDDLEEIAQDEVVSES